MTRAITVVVALILAAVAVALACAQLSMNAYFWHATNKADPIAQALFVGVSVVVGVSKFLIPALAVLTGRRVFRMGAVTAFLVIAVLFDALSGLGFSSLVKGEGSAEKREANQRRAEIARAIEAAEKALGPAGRAVAEIGADLKPAIARAPKCDRPHLARAPACVHRADLESELAAANARAEAAGKLAAMKTERDRLGPARDADPQFAAVRRGLAGFGATVSEETIGVAFGAFLFIVLELGTTVLLPFALAPLGRQPAPTVAAEPPAPVIRPRAKHIPEPASGQTAAPAGDVLTGLEAIRAGKLAARVTVAPDGWISGPQSAFADAIGISKTAVNSRFKKLAASGRVALRTDANGTHVRVVHRPALVA